MKFHRYLYASVILLILTLTTLGCDKKDETTIIKLSKPSALGSGTLKIFHVGSLAVPFKKIEEKFEALHPGIDIQREAYGSVKAIRQVTDLGKPAHVVGSADYRIIDSMMIDSEKKHASWNILFARNAMCLVLSPKTKPVSGADGWYAKLTEPGVKVGISNPNLDPCGYRSIMTLYLAQEKLGKTGLFEKLVLANANITVKPSDAGATIEIPGALKPKPNTELVVRPKETDLIPLVETSTIDCLFIYRSVAVQHGLKFVELPPEINLSDEKLDNIYGTVSVKLNSDNAEATKMVKGGAIVYGITVPAIAPEPDRGMAFVRYLQSEPGRKILEECGQEPLAPGTYSPKTKEKPSL